MASTEYIVDPDTGEHIGTIAWPDRKRYPDAYFTLNPGESVGAEIIENSEQRRLNSYEIAFEKHLEATIRHRREAFEARNSALMYAGASLVCALIAVIAVFWVLL